MDPAFILSLIYGHLFSKGVDSAMAVSERRISKKEFSDILDKFDRQFLIDYDTEITLCGCDMQSLTGKRSSLVPLAEKYITQNNADISRNLKQAFIHTAGVEIFGYADWGNVRSSKVVEKYLGYFYDLVFMKEISGISVGYRALLNAYTDSQYNINMDLYQRILDLEKTIRESHNNEIRPVDFKQYYEEVERRFTAKKRGEYRNLVGEEPDETSYIDAFITKEDELSSVQSFLEELGKKTYDISYTDAFITKEKERIPVLSFLEGWVEKTEPGVILIYGEPGHGKTMLCSKASFEFNKGRFLKEKAENVVAVSLNTGKNPQIIKDGRLKLSNALVFGTEDEKTFSFEDCRGSLLFLDGFDEFIDKAKEANIDNICSFMEIVDEIAGKYCIHIVILSRTIAVTKDLESLNRNYDYYRLSPLSDEQQDKWLDQHEEYDCYRETFDKLRNDKNMQKLLRVPFLFRLIVNSRFETVTSNIVELYDDLFIHLMHKRGIFDKEAIDTIDVGLMALAFEIYCTDTYMAKMDWNTQWVFAFYIESIDGESIGFFHRTFYQYFLAKYIYSGIIKLTDGNVEDFTGSFAERELDNTVLHYLTLMHKKEHGLKIHPNIEKMIDALVRTEAYINHTPRIETGDVEKSRILRSTNVYRNTLNVAAAVSYVIQTSYTDTLALMVRTFDSHEIILYCDDNKSPELIRADLRSADLGGACLSGAYLIGANLRRACLEGAFLKNTDLSAADLRGAYLSGADLRGAYLRSADLRRAYLRRADLRGAYLSGADLREAYLSGADLRGADLRSADLSGADLREADLRGADLREAYLSEADLSGADLSGTHLSKAKIDIKYKKKIDQSIDENSSIIWVSDKTTIPILQRIRNRM